MHRFLVISSVLAVLGLTSCEKGLVDGAIDAGSEQVTNSLLQVRTRTGGLGYCHASGWRYEHRYTWSSAQDDADSGHRHQQSAHGGHSRQRDDCPAVAKPHH